jgi:dTDP-4-amino-4,6-dideoxygalactose transaminase
MSRFRPIHHSFAPLGDFDQCLRVLGLMLCPWRWKHGRSEELLRSALKKFFEADAFLFGTCRDALRALLMAIHLKPGEEVIVNAYTCVVVPNAIHASGGVPIYCDIDRDTLNLDMEILKKTITPRTRAIICQHTFGIPADLLALRALCDAKGIFLIEDCAHIIPDETGPAGIGRVGDFVLLSFGRDKAISGVSGGAVLSRSSTISQLLHQKEQLVPDRSVFAIFRLLLYPLLYAIARPLYGIGIGKWFLATLKFLRVMPQVLAAKEKRGEAPALLHRIPNACAALALAQWKKRRKINEHRRTLTSWYLGQFHLLPKNDALHIPSAIINGLPLQKFPLFIENAQLIRQWLRRDNIHLDDGWTGCLICPEGVALDAIHYEWGNDPVAESLCMQILSLPTHPRTTIEDARTVFSLVRDYVKMDAPLKNS